MQFEKVKLTEAIEGMRIDLALSELCSISRSQAKQLLKNDNIRVNDEPINKAGYILKKDDELYVRLKEPTSTLTPEDIKLEVIHEDENLIVINKDPYIVVHPDESGHETGTVVNAVLNRLDFINNDSLRPGIVHRLDKDTSGVLVIAKNQKTLEQASKAFHDREVEKHYLALVSGRPHSDTGKIEAPIKRSSSERTQMAIHEQGKNAITHFKVLRSNEDVSLLDVEIKTGRTHQIRLHLASIGHPVLGDKKYGDNVLNESFRALYGLDRQFLHASELKIFGKTYHAELKKDLREVLMKLNLEL